MNPHALRPAPPSPPPVEHHLWTLSKRTHQVIAAVRATEFGPELRIAIDGELWWSHIYRGATEDILAAAADQKLNEFIAKGWVL